MITVNYYFNGINYNIIFSLYDYVGKRSEDIATTIYVNNRIKLGYSDGNNMKGPYHLSFYLPKQVVDYILEQFEIMKEKLPKIEAFL